MSNLETLLEAVRQSKGALTPSNVVAAARPVKAPLHGRFEWDNTVAGNQYRLIQAADLIRSVKLVDRDEDGESTEVRKYWAERQPGSAVSDYRPLEDIAQDPVRSDLLLAALERDWKVFKARWRHVEGFIELIRRDAAA